MNHEYSHHIHYGLDFTFCLCILILGTEYWKTTIPPFVTTIRMVFIRGKYSIVSMVVRHFHRWLFPKPLLEPLPAHPILVDSNGWLVLNPNHIQNCIIVYSISLKATICGISSITSRKSSRSLTNKVISRDKAINPIVSASWGGALAKLYKKKIGLFGPRSVWVRPEIAAGGARELQQRRRWQWRQRRQWRWRLAKTWTTETSIGDNAVLTHCWPVRHA